MKKFLFFILFILIFSIIQIYFWNDICDDSYITFRYVERFLKGKGITFNDGERVEGFSHPLWFFLLSFFKLLFPFKIETISQILGFLSSILILFFLYNSFENSKFSKSLSSLFLLTTPAFLYYSSSGLETTLFALLILLVFLYNKNYITSGIFLGLLSITRPEGVLYGILFFIFNFKKIKKYFYGLILFLIPFISYEIFRIIYFNDIFPNTFYAKPSGIYGSSGGIFYIFPWIYSIGGPFIFLLFFLKKISKSAIALIFSNLIFLIYTQGDWMLFGRLIFPIYPLILKIFCPFIEELLDKLKENFKVKKIIFLIFLPFFSLIVWYPQLKTYIKDEALTTVLKGKDQVMVGKWLAKNIKEGKKVSTFRLGGISYEAKNLVVLDLYGLTDREQGRWVYKGKSGGFINSPVIKKGVDIFACVNAPAKWGYLSDLDFLKYLKENYEFAISFKQGNFGTIDIWIKKGEYLFK